MNLILALVLFIQSVTVASAPKLTLTDNNFSVTYDVGAVYACMFLHPVGEFDQDRKPVQHTVCGFIDETTTASGKLDADRLFEGFDKPGEWDVWASMGYPRDGDPSKGEVATTTYVDYLTSNVLNVTRK